MAEQIELRRNGNHQTASPQMRTVLICHEGASLDQIGLAGWLSSFTNLAGVVVIRERKQRGWQRIRREVRRVGKLRFLDVLAFRLYYKLFLAAKDRQWERDKLEELRARYPYVEDTPILITADPNSIEVQDFIKQVRPDLIIARCKTLLTEAVFCIPSYGTFVMHPGICPEYRNAHGCFWALANDDTARVGLTLLKIDRGVDTGPVYGYYHYPFDEVNESHIVIQHRVLLENLDRLETKLREIHTGTAVPLQVTGRQSKTWGQPWLTRHLEWKKRAKRRTQ